MVKRASHPQSPAKYGGERDKEISQERQREQEKIVMKVGDMTTSFKLIMRLSIDMCQGGFCLGEGGASGRIS